MFGRIGYQKKLLQKLKQVYKSYQIASYNLRSDLFLCIYNMEWLTKFPEMERSGLREFKKSVDGAFTSFSRNYGEGIENFFDPLLSFLVGFEKLIENFNY